MEKGINLFLSTLRTIDEGRKPYFASSLQKQNLITRKEYR